jgi:GT2 family glycosyltransferase
MPERPRARVYRQAQRLGRLLRLLNEVAFNPRRSLMSLLKGHRSRSSTHPQVGLSWSVLVVLAADLSSQQIQTLKRQWPDASLWRLPQRNVEPAELLRQARAVTASYVLVLADPQRLDAELLSNLCRLVALNPGFDAWLSGDRPGLWSWDFSGFSLDPAALLLLRSSLLEQHAHAPRNRRNATHMLTVPGRDVLPRRHRPGQHRQGALPSSISLTDRKILIDLMQSLPLARPRVHPLPPEPRLVVVIPTRDRADLLSRTVAGLSRQQLPLPFELVVMDNGSEEAATKSLLETLASGTLLFQAIRDEKPFNFSALCNSGIAASKASLVLLLNNDVVFSQPHSLAAMLALAQLETVGCVGALLRYPDGRIQHLGVEMSGELVQHQGYGQRLKAVDPLLQQPRQVSAVTAACMLFRRSLWDELAGFDEDLPVDFNDVDFCLRAHDAGFANLITPAAEATHLESASRGQQPHVSFSESLRTMKARWGKHVGNDPYAMEIQSCPGWLPGQVF